MRLLLLFVQVSLFAQQVSVPFIGCVSYGQVDRRDPPVGASKPVQTTLEEARALAYYESGDGIGALGPRGWHCQGASGSGGSVLFLSPEPIDKIAPWRNGGRGAAIELNMINGEASGRYQIAELIGRFFPSYRAAARQTWADLDSPLPSGHYPGDTVKRRSKTLVEYATAPNTEGLGTKFSWLKKANAPITGAVMLVGERPDACVLSIRLPGALARLAPAITRFAVQEAAHAQ